MALLDIFATAISIGLGFLTNHLLGNPQYWNIIIVIGVYLFVTLMIHTFMKYHCKPWKSGPNPKHLIIICTGYLGHFERIKGIQDSFVKRYTGDDIMVYLPRNINTGFFFYTFWKSNDGINRGGMRLCNEIKSIIDKNISIDKISVIGCSLGGLYSRYCLKFLFDSTNIFTINGRQIELINYMSLASPHLGTKDWVQQSSLYSFALCLNKCHCLPLTLQQLLGLDQDNLIQSMASNDEYLKPLSAFKNHICFGNAKYDSMVSCSSALILNEQIGDKIWNENVENVKHKCFIKELNDNDFEIGRNEDDQDEDAMICWFQRLNANINWTKIIIGWNDNKCARNRSHELLAAPFTWYSGCKSLYDVIFDKLLLNTNTPQV